MNIKNYIKSMFLFVVVIMFVVGSSNAITSTETSVFNVNGNINTDQNNYKSLNSDIAKSLVIENKIPDSTIPENSNDVYILNYTNKEVKNVIVENTGVVNPNGSKSIDLLKNVSSMSLSNTSIYVNIANTTSNITSNTSDSNTNLSYVGSNISSDRNVSLKSDGYNNFSGNVTYLNNTSLNNTGSNDTSVDLNNTYNTTSNLNYSISNNSNSTLGLSNNSKQDLINTSTSISGHVTDSEGSYSSNLSNISVELIGIVGSGMNIGIVFKDTVTDNNGFYIFDNLSEGNYIIIIKNKINYIPEGSTIKYVVLDKNSSSINNDFKITSLKNKLDVASNTTNFLYNKNFFI